MLVKLQSVPCTRRRSSLCLPPQPTCRSSSVCQRSSKESLVLAEASHSVPMKFQTVSSAGRLCKSSCHLQDLSVPFHEAYLCACYM